MYAKRRLAAFVVVKVNSRERLTTYEIDYEGAIPV